MCVCEGERERERREKGKLIGWSGRFWGRRMEGRRRPSLGGNIIKTFKIPIVKEIYSLVPKIGCSLLRQRCSWREEGEGVPKDRFRI